MPSQADVEGALVLLAAAALYPNGTSSIPAVAAECRVYRGWPNATALEIDLNAGTVNISLFAVPHATTNTTRYIQDWIPTPVIPSLTVSTAGNTATFGGIALPGQLAGVLVDGISYVHRTVPYDTPELVAAVLGAAIALVRPATVAASTITIPNASHVIARTAADASAALELRCQRQQFRLTAWCPTPDLRDAVCEVLDIAMAATPFLKLADGSAARLTYLSTTTFDERQDAALYRRDLLYAVEFPTTQVAAQPSMLFGSLGLGATTITV